MENISGSWRVAVDQKSLVLHEALFIRDAAGLPVEFTSEIPARLQGNVPDISSDFSLEWRARASERWTLWWHELVRWVALAQLVPMLSDSAFALGRPPDRYPHSPPPSFPMGDDDESPAEKLESVRRMANQWRSTLRAELHTPRGLPSLIMSDSEQIGTIAEETAIRLGVPLESMRAVILTLAVIGDWSHRPLEGVLLCSEGVMENEALFETLLADTFISGLDRKEKITLPDRPASIPAFLSILDSSLLIAEEQNFTLRLEGAYVDPRGSLELEISRSEESTGPSPVPYGCQGQPSDPERFTNHFSGLEVDVHFEPEFVDKNNPPESPATIAVVNRFWRRGSGPNTLWLSVRVESPKGNIVKATRGHVTLTVSWPEGGIDHRSIDFELKESDPDENVNHRQAW